MLKCTGNAKLTPASIAAYQENLLFLGGTTETLEGDWKPATRFVMLEFPKCKELAREW